MKEYIGCASLDPENTCCLAIYHPMYSESYVCPALHKVLMFLPSYSEYSVKVCPASTFSRVSFDQSVKKISRFRHCHTQEDTRLFKIGSLVLYVPTISSVGSIGVAERQTDQSRFPSPKQSSVGVDQSICC